MADSTFWTTASDRHRRIAEEYYRNIELTHPGAVTSKGMCTCLDYSNWCGWAATKVKYYEYRGPRPGNL